MRKQRKIVFIKITDRISDNRAYNTSVDQATYMLHNIHACMISYNNYAIWIWIVDTKHLYLYTLSHPKNDHDVTEHVQLGYMLQDAPFMHQCRCSFLNASENTQVAHKRLPPECALTSQSFSRWDKVYIYCHENTLIDDVLWCTYSALYSDVTWSTKMSHLSKMSISIFSHHFLKTSKCFIWCKPHYNWISGYRVMKVLSMLKTIL